MNFEALMEQLRTEYVDDLPSKIKEIESRLKNNEHQVVREDFHKLKGTGKTYGVPEISQLAEVVERICVASPQDIQRAVPDAISLLKEIHSQRVLSQSFDITADQRFARLKRLVT